MIRLFHGNNTQVLHDLKPQLLSKITLAYLDPPFFSGKTYKMLDDKKTIAFRDLGSEEFYLLAIHDCLEALKPLLAEHGSVVIHVDSKMSHRVRLVCDNLFGRKAFASEIIWRYRRWPTKTPNFQRVHDVLIRYVKDPKTKPRFNQLYEPLAPSTMATFDGRKQLAITGAGGQRIRSSATEEASPGVPLGDVWDIPILAPRSSERTGYPTQKPVALLQRLVHALSSPGDWILDPYAGSGTTLAVAKKTGRNGIGIDQSPEAIKVARKRLISCSGRLRID